jgi:hypothetical protein
MADWEVPQLDFTLTSCPVVVHEGRKLRVLWRVDLDGVPRRVDPLKDLKRMARNARRNERRRQNKAKSL